MYYTDYSWYNYINLTSLISLLIWFIILYILASNKLSKIDNSEDRKWYMYTFFFKIGFSILFGLIYIFIIGGGDTLAYWEASKVMHNMYQKSPDLYFEQIFSEPNWENYFSYFNHYVGYPPGFIYREPESYFVSKIVTIISFATFKSYLATTMIISFLATNASWKLYVFFKTQAVFKEKFIKIGVLLMPSVAFWCSGVSKDAIIFISVLNLVTSLFSISFNRSKLLYNLLSVLLNCFIIYHIRDFMLYVILLSFIAAYLFKLLRAKKDEFLFNALKTISVITALAIILVVLTFSLSNTNLAESNSLLSEAATVQNDFNQNATYSGKRYSLGEVDYSPIGILKVMPLATMIGIFEPLPWNATSPLLIINGLESILIIYLTWKLVKKGFFRKLSYIRSNEILLFCLIFTIIIGFMSGFTSILYGVLVRIKAPLIPFLMIVLALDWDSILQNQNLMMSDDKVK